MNDIDSVESFGADLVAALGDTDRRALAQDLASRLKKSQQQRIGMQMNPDGSAYEPRKLQLRHKSGKIKREMFSKLRTSKYLKSTGTADAAIVGFTSEVSPIARVHQLGLRDRVNKRGTEADYPARQLLGISAADESMSIDLIASHLANRL